MFIQVQNNPLKKNTGDCAIRAVAIAQNITWTQAYVDLCTQGLKLKDLPNANSVWGSYLQEHGYKRGILSDSCPDCYTVKDFAYDHPYGTYVVCTGSHVVAVIDGDYLDAWDSGNEVPTYYFYKGD
jgi:hypothetical protein